MNDEARMLVYYDTKKLLSMHDKINTEKYIDIMYEIREIPVIVSNDALNECVKLINAGLNPAILNISNDKIPGGNVYIGARGTEEELYRRTNLSIDNKYYPLTDVLYTKNVTIIKNGEDVRYTLSSDDKKISVITVGKNYENISMIFKVAISKGHDSLVIGSLDSEFYKKLRECFR